ncbi:MAG TPA: cyclic nucleotide-binding domain-containing protein [Sediminispirochaeta sp.]|nr:cyclic nucleotide-binding domain-containing protein [Sediminispirochaeta sp.]
MEEWIKDRLRSIKLFEDFSEDRQALERISGIGEIIDVKKGQRIIEEGEEGDSLFVLLSGSVRVEKTTLQNQPYTVVILRDDENVYFGELALIDKDRRSATVVNERDCTLFQIKRESFLAFCEKDPYMGYKITMQIARKISASLRKMNSDVITLFEALVSEVEGSEISL